MKTRPLLRTDLPKKRSTCDSLHIPVLLKNKKRFICDIHFANDHLCYLENAKGIPTRIRNLQLIIDGRSNEDIKNEIERKQKKQRNLSQHVQKLQREIMKLKSELSL
jgi:hypothetical protein